MPRYDQNGNEIFYFKHVQKMKELGITDGCTATEFCPSSPPTPNNDGVARNDAAAVFSIRAAQRKVGSPLFFHATAAVDTTFETYSPDPWFQDAPVSQTVIFRYVQRIRDLVVPVPFDTPLRLWVNPNAVAVQAPDGRVLSRAGSVVAFQVSRLSPTVEFRLRVVPGGPR